MDLIDKHFLYEKTMVLYIWYIQVSCNYGFDSFGTNL